MLRALTAGLVFVFACSFAPGRCEPAASQNDTSQPAIEPVENATPADQQLNQGNAASEMTTGASAPGTSLSPIDQSGPRTGDSCPVNPHDKGGAQERPCKPSAPQ
jgi:hypothetical protein